MSNGIQTIDMTEARDLATVAESLVTRGDLSGLTPGERARHYVRTCEGLGLNPHSQPFSFLTLQGKLVMYANRGASDQLAAMHRVNRRIIRGPEEITLGGQKLVIAVCEATMPNGRIETAIATVPMTDPVNVLMKAETKAKRRVTLSILGLGMLDETEVETIPGAVRVDAPRLDVRDDAPAQIAAPDRLAAFTADLSIATDLAGVRVVYDAHAPALGGTSAKPITDAVRMHLGLLGYRLTAVEAAALIGGTLADDLATAYDRLTAVDRHADDEDGDAVVADVVRVLRGCGALPKPLKARVMAVAIATVSDLGVPDAKERLTAALSPQPPTTPTGTDAPTASTGAASAHGGAAVDASQTAGAQALRTVLDTDAAHVQVAGTWRASDEGQRAHLAEMTVRRRVEASVGCNGALLGPTFVTLAAERIVAIDAERPHPAGVARLTVIGVVQTLERIALDASRERAAVAARAVAA
jgi:hypothetical protein